MTSISPSTYLSFTGTPKVLFAYSAFSHLLEASLITLTTKLNYLGQQKRTKHTLFIYCLLLKDKNKGTTHKCLFV